MQSKLKFMVLSSCDVFALGTTHANQITRAHGAPVSDNLNSQAAGPNGPVLLQDTDLIEKLAAFDRERIPERVVHARGVAAKGVFTATADLSDLTMADPFEEKGKQTPVLLRFSSVINSKGSPETLRDPRGFAIKFYTDDGNWDIVGNNFPVFFIRDAKQFPDMVHSLKPDPISNLQDPNRYFDFFSFKPEATHMLTLLFSPLGIPTSLREMDGSGVHAFKFVNNQCDVNYVKFTWKSRQGNNGMTPAEASAIQAVNFNHHTQDLYEHIEAGDFPVWDLFIQTIPVSSLNDFDFNPLDTTKIWPEEMAASRKVGELVLNEVPEDFFQWTEQSAFAPSNLIPGIEASEDRMLQGRLFSYADTQRYRLGINHFQLSPNKPNAEVHAVTHQAGAGFSTLRERSTNYFPSRYVADDGYGTVDAKFKACPTPLVGTTQQIPFQKTQNFQQAGALFRSFDTASQKSLVETFGGDLANVESEEIRNIITSFLYKADRDYGTRVGQVANADMDEVRRLAASYTD